MGEATCHTGTATEVLGHEHVDIQRVGDAVLLIIDGTQILLARGDAAQLGIGLYQVATAGGDTLDEMPRNP